MKSLRELLICLCIALGFIAIPAMADFGVADVERIGGGHGGGDDHDDDHDDDHEGGDY